MVKWKEIVNWQSWGWDVAVQDRSLSHQVSSHVIINSKDTLCTPLVWQRMATLPQGRNCLLFPGVRVVRGHNFTNTGFFYSAVEFLNCHQQTSSFPSVCLQWIEVNRSWPQAEHRGDRRAEMSMLLWKCFPNDASVWHDIEMAGTLQKA